MEVGVFIVIKITFINKDNEIIILIISENSLM